MENKEETDTKPLPGGGGGDTGIFKCPECNSIFKRRDHLGRHVMTQHDENSRRTKCPLKDCDTEMVRRDHLRRHISQVHKVDPSEVLPYSRRKPSFKKPTSFDPTQRFKCVYDGCDAELSRKDHLCRHIKNIHKADPREVIGHMYKQPRSSTSAGGAIGNPTATSTPISASSTSGKSKKRSKKKRGGITNAEDSSLASSHSADHPHHHPNHHQGHHPHQPHPSTLSDYDYGADFCSGDSDFEGEYQTDDLGEGDAVLCFLCCFSFYPDDLSKVDLSKNFQFSKFVKEIFKEHDDGTTSTGSLLPDSPKMKSCLKQLTVCSDCLSLVNAAMDRKLVAEKVEITVSRLQKELLLDKKALQERLAEYSSEMKTIEQVISSADVKALKHFLKKNKRKDVNNVIMSLRERIVAAADKLGEPDKDVQIKRRKVYRRIQQQEEESSEEEVNSSASSEQVKVPFDINDSSSSQAESNEGEREKDKNKIEDSSEDDECKGTIQQEKTPSRTDSDKADAAAVEGEQNDENDRCDQAGDLHLEKDNQLLQRATDTVNSDKYSEFVPESQEIIEDAQRPENNISGTEKASNISNLDDQSEKNVQVDDHQKEKTTADSARVEDVPQFNEENDALSEFLQPIYDEIHGSNSLVAYADSCQVVDELEENSERGDLVLSAGKENFSQRADAEDWSQFKKNVVKEIKRRFQKRSEKSSLPNTQNYGSQCDVGPSSNRLLNYSPETDELFVGEIIVRINEEKKFLLCSHCPFRTVKEEFDGVLLAKQKVKKMVRSIEDHINHTHVPMYLQQQCDGNFINQDFLYEHAWDTQLTQKNAIQTLQFGVGGENNFTQDTQQSSVNSSESADLEPYRCNICGKKFIFPKSRRIHEKVHSDHPDMCRCVTCGKLFVGKASLLFHQRQSCSAPGKRLAAGLQENGEQSNGRKRRKLEPPNTTNVQEPMDDDADGNE